MKIGEVKHHDTAGTGDFIFLPPCSCGPPIHTDVSGHSPSQEHLHFNRGQSPGLILRNPRVVGFLRGTSGASN